MTGWMDESVKQARRLRAQAAEVRQHAAKLMKDSEALHKRHAEMRRVWLERRAAAGVRLGS